RLCGISRFRGCISRVSGIKRPPNRPSVSNCSVMARLQEALLRYPVGSLVSHSHCRLILSDFVSFVLVLPPTAFVVPSVKPNPPPRGAGGGSDRCDGFSHMGRSRARDWSRRGVGRN